MCHEPDDAFCHLRCVEDCESWNEDHEHELVDSGGCNIVEWLTAGDPPEEFYAGPESVPISDGIAIDASWMYDGYEWSVKQ